MTYTVTEAKAQLSALLVKVEAGEEVIIARGSHEVARLVPARKPFGKRVLGALRGQITIPAGFDDPLPEFEHMFYDGDDGHSA